MKKTFKVEGLDCANCAAKIERGVAALDSVTNCTLNFMTGKMIIEAEDDKFDSVLDAAHKVVRKMEPDAVLKKI